ncbi:MAG TPA: hypothetical protein VKY57_16830 [Chitinispirillaceae bacterium]|nr:hypothetical protein [Chitinispirillaceae bacterium]
MQIKTVKTAQTKRNHKSSTTYYFLNRWLPENVICSIKNFTCFLFIYTALSFGDTIFVDHFSNEPISFKNWKAVCSHENMFTIENETAKLNNQDIVFCGFAIHPIQHSLPEFTFSASISSQSPGAGLFFCISQTLEGYYCGYAVIIGDDALYILKYQPDEVKIEEKIKTPFIKPVSNELQISRNNNLCNIFCNGYYSGSFTISNYGNDFALIVQPSTEATFDNIVIESRFKDSTLSEWFYDDFSSDYSFGWSITNFAQNTRIENALKINTKNKQIFFSFIPIPLNDFNVKAVSSLQSQSDTTLFGIYIKVKMNDSVSDYLFGVCGNGDYYTGFNDDAVKENKGLTNDYTNGNGSGSMFNHNTLEIKNKKDVFSFSINEIFVSSCNIQGDILGAGIFAFEDLEVHFYEFSLNNLINSPPNEHSVGTTDRSVRRLIKIRSFGTNRYFDLLGRSSPESIEFKSGSGIFVKSGNKKIVW